MDRFDPVRSSDRGLKYLARIGVHLDFDIRVHRKLGDAFTGTNIDPLDVLPSRRFESLNFLYIAEH